ncbi:DUF4192 domain-containing protein [Arthrobacter sp. SLBN-122]|uniref:DUF4192 domain-containing protein n=1 Tax=Arthrobacter sp. SLBN-122 TaxID=2768455 RepID=UPI0011517E9E|nr:DUF4192 domain-containing protein [Arthrobacter sp. SLBN-122]TQJ36186.1 uncharacterized protein DUF4192 [Arthrobacter sp. SLBN-122]
MTASDRLIVRGPEDILGFIPHSLGYWPEASLVAMTLHGTRLGATLRLDLPGPEMETAPALFARAVRRYLASDQDADGSLLAVFTSDAGMVRPSPYDFLLSTVQGVLGQAGMPVRDAWFVGDEYWRDALCSDASCCPLPGRPLQEIRDSMLNTEMVYRGSSVGPAPRAARGPEVQQAPVPALHLAALLEAQAAWEAELGGQSRSRAHFTAVLDFWESLLDRTHAGPWIPDVERDAFLRATLIVPTWRDAVLVMAAAGRAAAEAGAEQFGVLSDASGDGSGHSVVAVPLMPPAEPAGARQGSTKEGTREPGVGGPRASRRAAGRRHTMPGAASGSVPAGYGEVLMGLAPDVPDWAGLDALDRILGELAVPGGTPAAAALTLRGWVAWCRGRGSYAAAHLGQALGIEPEYRLAELLLDLVGRGTLCGWAARKEAAWQKFRTDPAGQKETL